MARKFNRIDVHHHLSPPGYIAELGPNQRLTPQTLAWTPEKAIEQMEKGGVDLAITSITTPGIWFGLHAAARRLAREKNVDITLVAGSGPGGRIVEADVALEVGTGTGGLTAFLAERADFQFRCPGIARLGVQRPIGVRHRVGPHQPIGIEVRQCFRALPRLDLADEGVDPLEGGHVTRHGDALATDLCRHGCVRR